MLATESEQSSKDLAESRVLCHFRVPEKAAIRQTPADENG